MCVRQMISDGRSSTAIAARGRLLEPVERDVLAEVLDVPAVGLVAGADVLAEGELGVALDRDVVVVVEDDQAAEAEVAGERARPRTVMPSSMSPSEAIAKVWWSMTCVAVDVEARGEHPLGERQPDARRDALAERARSSPRSRALARTRGGPASRRAELAEAARGPRASRP